MVGKEKEAAIAVSSPDASRERERSQGYESEWQGGCGIIKIRSEETFRRKSRKFCFGQIRNDQKAEQLGLCVREAVRYARLDGTEQKV